MYFTHGLFLTCSQKSHLYLQVTYLDIYKYTIISKERRTLALRKWPHIAYLESQLFAHGDETPFTLVFVW